MMTNEYKLKPDKTTYSIMINGYNKGGDFASAEKSFNKLLSEGYELGIEIEHLPLMNADEPIYLNILNACGQHKQLSLLEKLWENISKLQIASPKTKVYRTAISAFSLAGNIKFVSPQ